MEREREEGGAGFVSCPHPLVNRFLEAVKKTAFEVNYSIDRGGFFYLTASKLYFGVSRKMIFVVVLATLARPTNLLRFPGGGATATGLSAVHLPPPPGRPR